MQTFHIISVGSIRQPFFADGIAEYEKRLGAYVKVCSRVLKEEPLPQNSSPAQIRAALAAEGKRILAAIPPRSYVTALCIEGNLLSTEQLAKKLEQTVEAGFGHVVFLIGSSFGLDPSVKAAANFKLSFSPMTFPHQLMRMLLLEQLYRAKNYSAGGKYHK